MSVRSHTFCTAWQGGKKIHKSFQFDSISCNIFSDYTFADNQRNIWHTMVKITTITIYSWVENCAISISLHESDTHLLGQISHSVSPCLRCTKGMTIPPPARLFFVISLKGFFSVCFGFFFLWTLRQEKNEKVSISSAVSKSNVGWIRDFANNDLQTLHIDCIYCNDFSRSENILNTYKCPDEVIFDVLRYEKYYRHTCAEQQ